MTETKDLAPYEASMAANPREEGEDVIAWMERVNAGARPVGDSELPRRDREVGEEG